MASMNISHRVNNRVAWLVVLLCLCFVVAAPHEAHPPEAKSSGISASPKAQPSLGGVAAGPQSSGGGGSRVRGMFVFGSSLVDNGNNNYLENSTAKANFSPYGVDFPTGPTGRFTNGRNVIDLFGQHLKLPDYIPAFKNPSTKGPNILHGVDFASGGSGILDDTGSVVGQVICMNQQIRNLKEVTLPELEKQSGEKCNTLLSKYLFVIGAGGNDYSFNYLLRVNTTYRFLTLKAFTDRITSTLVSQLKELYSLGARKFVLISMYPNGCSPMAKSLIPSHQSKVCMPAQNRAARQFNTKLREMADSMKVELPGSHFVFFNSFKIIMDIIKNPAKRGFNDTDGSCCEGEGGHGILCKRGGTVCKDRKNYVYFDGLHPTEAVNVLLAKKAFNSDKQTEVYPFNLKKLSEI